MLDKREEYMTYTDEEGDYLTIEQGEDYPLMVGVNDNGQVGVSSADVVEVVRAIVELAGLNVTKDFVVAKKEAVEEVYVATPTTAPLAGGHMFTNEDIEKLVSVGDIFQSRETPETFVRVVEIKGGTIIYVSGYSLFNENPLRAELRTPFARFISSFAMWRPAPPVTTTGTSGPLIPERLAAAGYAKDKVEVKWFKPEVESVQAQDVKLGDKLWVKNSAHEVIGNDVFSAGNTAYRRLSFRNDSYSVIYRTDGAEMEKLK